MKRDKNMRFYELLRDFLIEYLLMRRNFSPKTVLAYKQSLNLYRNYFSSVKGIRFGEMDFTCFSKDDVYAFLTWLKQERGCAPQTQNLRLAAIKSFLRFCGEEDVELTPLYLAVSGIHEFKTQKKQRVEYLTKLQLKILFKTPDTGTYKGRRDRFFLIFAYETGARLDELINLRLSDIVRANGYVTIRILGKGSKLRYVPLEPTTVCHLDAYIKEFHDASDNTDYLFFTIHDGKHTQMKPGTVDYMMKRHAVSAHETDSSFPLGLHCHMLRHSIAMAMLKKGIPISYIRDFLGHSSIETTTVYSHADDEMIAAALSAIDHEQPDENPKRSAKGWKGKEEYLLRYCGLL
jgi:site-specific recombinase XerD